MIKKEADREKERDASRKDHSKTIPLMLFQADQVSGKNTYQLGTVRSGRE